MNEFTDKQQEHLDDRIAKNEYYKALKSFQKYEALGNDGLMVEFYLSFWHRVGKCLVNALHLHFPHGQGQPSNSQKQALISLLEIKDKLR